MTRFFILISVLLLGVLCPKGGAQDLSHKVGFPSGAAAWTVTFEVLEPEASDKDKKEVPPPEAKADDSLLPPQVKKIVVARNNNIRRDIMTWSDGKTTECWWMQEPPFVFQDTAKGGVSVKKVGNMGDSRYDESIFSWVGAGTFKGMKELKKKECRYYAQEITLPNMEKAILMVWIDNKTTLPVAWSAGGGIAVFSFDGQSAPENLKLPERFQPRLKKLEAFFSPPPQRPAKN